MDSVITAASLFATAGLLGSMLFFSGVVAPLVFARLEMATAGAFIRALFPWYYLVVIVTSAAAAAGLAFSRPVDALALAGIAAAGVIARQVLMPRINAARDRALAGENDMHRRFARLHRLSVAINVVQVLTAAVVLVRFVPA